MVAKKFIMKMERERSFGSESDSLGVVVPIFNEMARLPEHVEAMNRWGDLAQSVVLVDSSSTDGSREYIQSNYRHGNLGVFNAPRGLYASWNFGIQQLSTSWCYISTIGDLIDRDGLENLVRVGLETEADVVVTPPRFFDGSGKHLENKGWPPNRLMAGWDSDEIQTVEGSELLRLVFRFAFRDTPLHSLLGSCASCLFRTATLQGLPFPLNCGRSGDTAWIVLNAPRLRVAFQNRSVASFQVHYEESVPILNVVRFQSRLVEEVIREPWFAGKRFRLRWLKTWLLRGWKGRQRPFAKLFQKGSWWNRMECRLRILLLLIAIERSLRNGVNRCAAGPKSK
jgi:glycosyltransferase involved in cell wall biosynthesis